MTRLQQTVSARQALRFVLGAGLLLMLGANMPGHLSYDSVAQLYEGHFHVRETWGPAIYAWLLGLFDAIIPGTSLYVAASGLLFFASLWGLAALRGRVTWLGVAFAAFLALTPQVLIYQGVVWKDIAFANTAIGGAACLAQALTRWETRSRWPWLLASLVLFAVASLARQNGVFVPLLAAMALGWAASRGRLVRGLAWTGGALAALIVAIQLLGMFAVPELGAPDDGAKTGVRIVQNYDLIGAVTLDPSYRLSLMDAAAPKATAVIRERGPRNWSPDRVDWLDRDPVIGAALVAVPNKAATAQWFDLILHHPALYLRLRMEDFRWVFLTPNIDRCLPVYTGVDAPAVKMAPLHILHRYSRADAELTNYDSWFLDTPLHLHWAYALAALAVAGVLLWVRRDPTDLVVAALMLGALAFAASFFVITIACDYRYMYFLDLAGLVGLFYLAVDPPGRRRG